LLFLNDFIADSLWFTDLQTSNDNGGFAVRSGLEFIGFGTFTLFLGWIVVMMV